MNEQDFKQFRRDFLTEAVEVSDSKSVEYTISNMSKLYNFTHVAERVGITPGQALMVYLLKHVDALCNDAKTGKTYSDETTRSRCIDIANYAILYAALSHTENENENNTESNRDGISMSVGHDANDPKPAKWHDLQRDQKT